MNPTRPEVVRVIKECTNVGLSKFLARYGYRQSTKYDLIFGPHRYPPKAIYNVARKRSLGEDDRTGDLRGLPGGRAVNDPLRRLGFTVVAKDQLEIGLDTPDGALDDNAERSIALRRGQAKFRAMLMQAYERRCAVTGCAIGEVLEACHLRPYSDAADYELSNGILLRADIHTLFDLGLIRISPTTLEVTVHPSISDAEYRRLDGQRVRDPILKQAILSRKILRGLWDSQRRYGPTSFAKARSGRKILSSGADRLGADLR